MIVNYFTVFVIKNSNLDVNFELPISKTFWDTVWLKEFIGLSFNVERILQKMLASSVSQWKSFKYPMQIYLFIVTYRSHPVNINKDKEFSKAHVWFSYHRAISVQSSLYLSSTSLFTFNNLNYIHCLRTSENLMATSCHSISSVIFEFDFAQSKYAMTIYK